MNYTNSYHLPQWDENDRILRADFNQMCADLENGMKQNAQTAAEAKSAAQTAVNTANTRPYRVGSYTGTGSDKSQSVYLGFRPSFLIISGDEESAGGGATKRTIITGGDVMSKLAQLTGSGFTLAVNNLSPQLNSSGVTYNYIAFK